MKKREKNDEKIAKKSQKELKKAQNSKISHLYMIVYPIGNT
ncbi:MAG TPA: hypothetical protein PLQ98_00345 [Bacillota bacterium]|nr:hypothetical protein [Bacillota bacterium]